MNGIHRKDNGGKLTGWRRHPITGRRYRRVFGDCGNKICRENGPHWYNEVEPLPCTAEDGVHRVSCHVHRIYVPEIFDRREVR